MQSGVMAKLSKLSPEAISDAFSLFYQLYRHNVSVLQFIIGKIVNGMSVNVFPDREWHTWHSDRKDVGSEENGVGE